MNWRAILAIVRKDLKVAVQSPGIIAPMIGVPLIFVVVIPLVLSLVFGNDAVVEDFASDAAILLENLPQGIRDEIAQYESEQQTWLYLALTYLFAPFFLILPLMVATVIGADSFAGEKERKTLEALIYTPVSDLEIYLGKMLAAWVPAVVIGISGAVVYCLVANIAAAPIMGGVFLPNLMWILLAFWLSPAVAGLGLAAMVLVSSRARGFQEANQIGGLVVLPLVLLVVGQLAGVVYLSVTLVALLGFVLLIIDAGLLWFGASIFQRQELIARL